MSNGEFRLIDIFLAVFISCMAIGGIWIIAETVGQFLKPEYWLLIIGVIGFLAIYTFLKIRKT